MSDILSSNPKTNSPSVITVILNTNRRDDTLEALSSLAKTDYANHRVIVLDNASTDGSVEAIRASYPEVEILSLETNLGFGGNNNVGIRAALERGADWVFILNEDTTLAEDCISLMVAAGQGNARIGFVGPMVYHYDEPEVIQSAGGFVDKFCRSGHLGENELDRGQFKGVRPVDWVSGCGMLVRRETIEQVGLLDERFFYCWDETDWALNSREYGWKSVCVSEARMWHKGVQRNYRPSANVTYYSTRNWFLFQTKRRFSLLAWIYIFGRTILTLLSWTVRPKWRSMREHRDAKLQGVLDFLGKRWGKRQI